MVVVSGHGLRKLKHAVLVVVVAMDFMSQVQSHLMSSQYAKLMEKSNLQNYGRRR